MKKFSSTLNEVSASEISNLMKKLDDILNNFRVTYYNTVEKSTIDILMKLRDDYMKNGKPFDVVFVVDKNKGDVYFTSRKHGRLDGKAIHFLVGGDYAALLSFTRRYLSVYHTDFQIELE